MSACKRNGGPCNVSCDDPDDCDCNECAQRRLIAELVAEVKRLRHDLTMTREAMVRAIAITRPSNLEGR